MHRGTMFSFIEKDGLERWTVEGEEGLSVGLIVSPVAAKGLRKVT